MPPVADVVARLRARGVELPPGPVRVDAYGDSPELSASLLALIRDGRKRAGTSLLWSIEGEGDGSLEYWRKAHWAFFSRECKRIGRAPAESMPVVCSVFEVLRVLPAQAA